MPRAITPLISLLRTASHDSHLFQPFCFHADYDISLPI
jgi:hypothetical protein